MSVLTFDCRFAYPKGFALDFAFQAESGITSLVGPSGCGKTTVLNLIAGLLRPQDGRIALGDEVLLDKAKAINLRPERRGIGYVFQDFMLFPHRTVGENLRYGLKRQKGGRIEVDQVVGMLELGEFVNRMPASLSGGQKQRVALGRALLRNPRLLLMDEPLNALDTELRANVAQYLVRIVSELAIPTVLVSHDAANVGALGAKVVRMM